MLRQMLVTHCLEGLTAFVLVFAISVVMMQIPLTLSLDQQTGFTSTSDVKGSDASLVVALDTSSMSLTAQVALELPAGLWYPLYAVNGLHVDWVADSSFWDPHCTEEMSPFAVSSLLECASFVRTEQAGYSSIWRDGTLAAEPLAFGDVRDTVAVCRDRGEGELMKPVRFQLANDDSP